MEPTEMTMAELSVHLGYSVAHLRRLSSKKAIVPASTKGKTFLFNVDAVRQALKNCSFKQQRRSDLNPHGYKKTRNSIIPSHPAIVETTQPSDATLDTKTT